MFGASNQGLTADKHLNSNRHKPSQSGVSVGRICHRNWVNKCPGCGGTDRSVPILYCLECGHALQRGERSVFKLLAWIAIGVVFVVCLLMTWRIDFE